MWNLDNQVVDKIKYNKIRGTLRVVLKVWVKYIKTHTQHYCRCTEILSDLLKIIKRPCEQFSFYHQHIEIKVEVHHFNHQ